jgi:hypothetical protein
VPGTHQGLDSHTKDSDAELKVGLRFGGVWENHMSTKQRGRKVWLVSWVWCGDHAKRDPKVVAIFRPQLSGERVRELVEFLYGHFEYSLRERVDCALNPKANPYRAQFGAIGRIRWAGEINCGDNPYLKARLVDNLIVDEDNNATWIERKRPRVGIEVLP